MVLFAAPFPTMAPGALLTGRPTQAASNAITKTVAIAEKIKLVAEIASVRAGRIKLFMVSDVSSVCVNRITNGRTPAWDKLAAGDGRPFEEGSPCLRAGF